MMGLIGNAASFTLPEYTRDIKDIMFNPPPDAAPWCAAHATAFDFKTHEHGQWDSHPKQGGGGCRYKGQAMHSLPTSGAVAVLVRSRPQPHGVNDGSA